MKRLITALILVAMSAGSAMAAAGRVEKLACQARDGMPKNIALVEHEGAGILVASAGGAQEAFIKKYGGFAIRTANGVIADKKGYEISSIGGYAQFLINTSRYINKNPDKLLRLLIAFNWFDAVDNERTTLWLSHNSTMSAVETALFKYKSAFDYSGSLVDTYMYGNESVAYFEKNLDNIPDVRLNFYTAEKTKLVVALVSGNYRDVDKCLGSVDIDYLIKVNNSICDKGLSAKVK